MGKCAEVVIALGRCFSAITRILVLMNSLSDTSEETGVTEKGGLQYTGSGVGVVANRCAHGEEEKVVEWELETLNR